MIQKRRGLRQWGLEIFSLPPGTQNAITDVKGVAVGHCTIIKGDAVRTGVTAILPHQGNIFKDKVPAAVEVINGFGKAAGLTQINELGELETPIILTNTLSVGLALDALVEYKLKRNPEIGLTGPAVNGVDKSYQKPKVEKNHTLFRDIVPKGNSFDHFTQDTVNLIFSHINSVKRKSLGGKTPYEMFAFTYGAEVATLLGITSVSADKVNQSPSLLKK